MQPEHVQQCELRLLVPYFIYCHISVLFRTLTVSTCPISFTTSVSSQITYLQPIDEWNVLAELEEVKKRLRELEASTPPSYGRPWVIEVVLIPSALFSSVSSVLSLLIVTMLT
jgi:hypothetical protein